MPNKKLLAAGLLGGLLMAVGSIRYWPTEEAQAWLQHWSHDWGQARQEAESKAATQDRQIRLEVTEQRVDGLMKDSRAHMLAVIETARRKAQTLIDAQRADNPRLTYSADDKLQGYGNAMGLARRLAEDKVRGTHKTKDYLQEAFGPMVHAQALTEARILRILKECAAQLNVEAAHVQAATAQILDAQGFKAADLGLEQNMKRLAESQAEVLKSSMHAAVATVEVAVEALLIKTTYQAISKFLAKAVAKEVASLAIGAEGAAIPVADVVTTIIAVGGTVWTAFDVGNAVNELKKVQPVIRSGLDDSTSQLEKKTQEAFSGLETTTSALFNPA